VANGGGHHCLLFNQATGTVRAQLFGILSMLIVLFRRYIDFPLIWLYFLCGLVRTVCLMCSSNCIRIRASYSWLMVPCVVDYVYIYFHCWYPFFGSLDVQVQLYFHDT